MAEEKAARKPTIQYGGRAEDKNNEAGHLAEQFLLHNYTSVIDSKRLIHCFNNQFYKYTGTHYTKIDEEVLRDGVYKCVRDHSTQKRTSGLLDTTWKFVRAEIRLAEERKWNTWINEPPLCGAAGTWLAFQNGILNLDKPVDGIRRHTANWFSQTCLPFNYQPEADCPNWHHFMEETFGGDEERKALLQEWMGYCLTPDNSLNKFMLFEGPTRAGKGVTADVLCRILGEDNVSDIGLEMFDDRFQLSETAGKLLNVCDETDQIERIAEARLKRFTGATSKFFFDVKGVRGFAERVTARILILSNNGIPIYDRSTALVARMLHLQFDKSHEGHEDIGLRDRLYREIDGIFNWALEGYARIRTQREFTLPARSAQALQQYREQSNPFKVWFDEHIEITRNVQDYILKLELLARHNEWLKERGHRLIADNMCGRQVCAIVPGIKTGRFDGQRPDGSFYRPWGWIGLRWR